MTTTVRAEVAHDLVYADLLEEVVRTEDRLGRQRDHLRREAGDDFDNHFRSNRRESLAHLTTTELLARASERYPDKAERYAADLDSARRAHDAAYSAMLAHERNYQGWSRFFVVTSSDGHIHRDTSCSTCYVTTTFGFLPLLSGLTEADAVEEYGEILCSVCYPSAPSEWCEGESKAKKEKRAQREAEKAERAAKKLAKALTLDGSPFTIPGLPEGTCSFDRTLTTLAAAKKWLTDAFDGFYLAHYREAHSRRYPTQSVQAVAEAVAAKTSDTPEAVLAAAQKRGAKRLR